MNKDEALIQLDIKARQKLPPKSCQKTPNKDQNNKLLGTKKVSKGAS